MPTALPAPHAFHFHENSRRAEVDPTLRWMVTILRHGPELTPPVGAQIINPPLSAPGKND